MLLVTVVPFAADLHGTGRDQREPGDTRRQLIADLRSARSPHAVPPIDADRQWAPLMEAEFQALRDQAMNQPVNPATLSLERAARRLRPGRRRRRSTSSWPTTARSLPTTSSRSPPTPSKLKAAGVANSEILSQPKIDFEVFFNHSARSTTRPCCMSSRSCWACLSWLGWTEPLRRASIWLLWFTFALHTFALVARIYISGRPPVTNLYSSAIFIGWAGVLLALVFESIYRLGLGNIVAAVIGFLTLLVAYYLSLDGDTFIVLQAVLDTQFWLATHVVCITLGYAATFVAGLWGVIYILLAHVFPVLDDDARRQAPPHDLRHALLRDLLQLRRHGARRPVGRRLVGPLLGLGPEGKRRADHRALERAGAARPLGRHGQGPRPGDARRRRQHRHRPGRGSASTSSASACTPTAPQKAAPPCGC